MPACEARAGKSMESRPAYCPGIDRALQKRRWVEVEGKDVYGSQRTLKVPIADIGPLLVLKLNAFEGRKHPKDAYDILLAVTAWHEGAEAAVAAFQAEETAGNSGFSRAKRAVEEHFVSLDQLAPTRAMQFLYEDSPVSGSQAKESMEDLVTIGQALQGRCVAFFNPDKRSSRDLPGSVSS